MKNLGNTKRMSNPTTKKLAWDSPISGEAKIKLTNRIAESRIPHYRNN